MLELVRVHFEIVDVFVEIRNRHAVHAPLDAADEARPLVRREIESPGAAEVIEQLAEGLLVDRQGREIEGLVLA